MKPRNASSTSTLLAVMNGALVMFTSWMGHGPRQAAAVGFSRQREQGRSGFHRLGFETKEEKKKMKKKFGKLSKEEQEKRESEYHRMKPEEFDRLMTRARRYTPHTIRLPAAWIDGLEAMAELEGEPGYHTMVRRWIEERLRQESRLALRLSRMPLPKIAALLKRQASKMTRGADDLG
jgi:hypothetical protein